MLQAQLGLRQLGILLGHTRPENLDLLVCCLQRLLNLPVGLLNVARRQVCSRHRAVSKVYQQQLFAVVGLFGVAGRATSAILKGPQVRWSKKSPVVLLEVCNWR